MTKWTLSPLRVPVVLLSLLMGAPAAATVNQALEHYGAGNFALAYDAFDVAAKRGDHLAQRNIGVMYLKGEHVEKDYVEAYAWLALAAQDEEFRKAGTHEKVLNVLEEEQKALALKRHQALSSQYDDDALREKMRPALSSGTLAVKSFQPLHTQRPDYPGSAARRGLQGWADIMFTIETDGTTSDHYAYISADSAFSKAAIEALRTFQFEPSTVDDKPVAEHGVVYRFLFVMENSSESERGRFMNRQLTSAREKAETGNPEDQFAYGYLTGAARSSFGDDRFLSEENLQNPNDWYMKAAKQGYSVAGFFLGRNTLSGKGCYPDPVKSHFWLVQSAEEGISDSQYLLAMELLHGVRFTKDVEQGFYWLQRAAQSNTAARLRYAWVLATYPDAHYRDGELAREHWSALDKDYHDRQRYYQTAAAIAAENGDFEKAVQWQEKALEDARELKIPTASREDRLALYRQKKPLRVDL